MPATGRCAVCDRFIGLADTCPYCDSDAPDAGLRRWFRRVILVLAVAGTFALWRTGVIGLRVFPATLPGPAFGWVAWSVIAFMLLTERTATTPGSAPGWRTLARAWRPPAAAVLTCGLSGFVGLRFAGSAMAGDPQALSLLAAATLGVFAVPALSAGQFSLRPAGTVAALAGTLALVFLAGGVNSARVCAVGAAIGLLPALYGARRIHGLGLFLLPLAVHLDGAGGVFSRWPGP